MAEKSIPVEGKKRGRPPGSAYADPIPVRLTAEQVAEIDAWRAGQDGAPSRSEAIRRLVAQALAGLR
ncbi:ribbon-helix-helix protein, CopG family [Salinarimonas sp.]|uniref:ribbon-helix-helix protein, CopG family n=1 Tax=Salinarimonas sp. TaxID=2766526 RepID=UPI0032D99EF6